MKRANNIRTADGAELFYRDWGTGTPLVFLAGWALPSDFWSYQMAPLCEAGFRCIAFDRRGHGRSSADTISWLKNMMLSCSFKAVLDCNRAMIEADFRAELKRIQIPTLIIHGDRDASAPLDLTSRRIVPLMPDVRLSVYEGAPHGLPITHAARLNQDLQAFLRAPPLSLPVAAARRSA
jgi:pimeloyl-ACP methyl ester carboxylesterase